MSVEATNTGTPESTVVKPPEGHDEKMAAAFDASQTPPTPETTEAPKAERPAHIPEKFWKDGAVDVEALAKSYTELEKGKSKPAETAPEGGTPPAGPEGVTAEQAGAASTEQAVTALESVGLDYNAISERYQQNGELAAEDRAALNKAGVPDAMIDAYVQGQQARADSFVKTVHDSVGGAEEYTKMVTWAGKGGLPAAEVTAFNKAMNGGDPEAVKLAVAGLKSRFDGAMGQEPKFVQGQTGPASAGDVFRSNAELVTAMRDARYKTDPAYRNDVIQKLNRSSIM